MKLIAITAIAIFLMGFTAQARDADVDHSGTVNSTDVLATGQHFTPGHPYNAQFDVNQDGRVDSTDQLLEYKCFNRKSAWNFNACVDQTSTAAFEGVNNWGLSQEDGFDSGCGSGGSATVREQKFTLWEQDHIQVVRVLVSQWHALKNGVRDWSVLDDMFARANAHRVRLIVPLENHWGGHPGEGGCNGTTKTCAWYQSGYQSSYDGLPEGFDAWVTEVVTRYSGNPALAAWEVMNEPWSTTACIHSFFVDISGRIRAADPATPISLGGNDSGGWDFATENAISSVTWVTVHGPYNDPTAMPQFVQDHITTAVNVIRKPIYVGERGLSDNNCTNQVAFYPPAIDAADQAGVIGFLAWAFSWNAGSTCQSSDFGPTSGVVETLAH